MKISVVVPVYNVSDYLEECVQSVLEQTYRDFEIILVNDGSTDKSAELCDKIAQNNTEHVLAFHQENKGPLSARMSGIKLAQGDVIVFLDGDDALKKDALSQIASSFNNYNCDLVMYATGVSVNFSCISIETLLKENHLYKNENMKTLYSKLILGEIPNGVCFKAIRKNRILLNEYFSELTDLKHGEDLLMSACFLTVCESAVYINEGLYYYRSRESSAIHSFDINRKESIKTVHAELSKCIDKWNMPELKLIHNSRKVKGWVETLKLLLKNKKYLNKTEFKAQLKSMSEDNYFREAYKNMDHAFIPRVYKIIAFCLFKKMYFTLNLISVLKK